MPDLDRELRALGEAVAFPDTPNFAPAVLARLPARPAPVWPRRLALVAAIVGVAVVAGLAVPQARTAILRFLGIGAVHVELVDRLPVVEPGAPLALGAEVDPDDAPFPVLLPAALGEPDGVFADGDIVTLVYGSPDAVRLLVTEIAGPPVPDEVVKKVVVSTTRAQFVPIEGADEPGLWIEGEPHLLVLPGAPPRLAANTLVWRRGDLTLRIEGAARLDDAVRIAESFR